jgi:hypothetical protein
MLPVWLVLCSATDHAAHWAYDELRRAGLAPLHIVAEDTLAMPLAFEHRIGERGVRTRIELAGGLVLDSHIIEGVLNRITAVPARHVHYAPRAERDYALMELNALWVSWLYALPAPLLNRPSPLGLCGAVRHVAEWRAMAAAAGLDPAPFRLADDDPAALRLPWERIAAPGPSAAGAGREGSPLGRRTVLVVGDEAVGDDVSGQVRQGCLALARSAGLGLLGAEFELTEGSWRFLDATPLPDLRQGGAAVIAALLATLTSGAGAAA